MDTKVIEVNKNIMVSTTLAAASSWNSNINIEFTPDAVIVRSILFSNGASGTAPGAFMLATNLTPQNRILGCFTENVITSSNVMFLERKPVQGTYNFQILAPASVLQPLTGNIYVHLEFIKYRETKEQKVY